MRFSQTRNIFPCMILLLLSLQACRDGDTTDIYEMVLVSDLNIQSIRLQKEHNDNLRPGREIQLQAFGLLPTGDEIDLSTDVRWFSSQPTLLKSQGEGKFLALSVGQTQTVDVSVQLSLFTASESITVSIAPLASLELGFSKEAVDGECQIAASNEMSQCSLKPLCVLGTYTGEADKREETEFVTFASGSGSVFVEQQLVNAPVNISSDVLENISAQLDGIASNTFQVSHRSDMTTLDVISPELPLVMGESASFDVNLNPVLKPFVQWIYTDFGDPEQPEASATFSGSAIVADYESDYVSSWPDYGVNVNALCSGFQSADVAANVISDIATLEISNNDDDDTLILDDTVGVVFTLLAENESGVEQNITSGQVSWYLCDLAEPACTEDDKLSENSEQLELIVGSAGYSEGDIRIEAVYHGVKAIETGFSIAQ